MFHEYTINIVITGPTDTDIVMSMFNVYDKNISRVFMSTGWVGGMLILMSIFFGTPCLRQSGDLVRIIFTRETEQ